MLLAYRLNLLNRSMTDYRIYLSPPSQNGQEQEYVSRALQSNWLAPIGPALDQFERDLSGLHNQKEVLALSSGTAAIHLALKLCDVQTDDYVLVASHTHNATVNPIIYEGANPVLVDCDKRSWNISPVYLEEAIQDLRAGGNKPKAIIVVHLYGFPADMKRIMEIAEEHEIPVIEDAAESLGSTLYRQPLGTFGTYGILSFNGNKLVTTSGGGALITNTKGDYSRALFLATQARDAAPHFQHSEIGYNYRMSNVLAALGSAQLIDLASRVEKRREIFSFYVQKFTALNERLGKTVVSWTSENEGEYSNRWLSTFLVEPLHSISRETWRLSLEDKGIESRPLWKPMHLQPLFSKALFYGQTNANQIFDKGICLPSGNELSTDELEEITSIIASLYNAI